MRILMAPLLLALAGPSVAPAQAPIDTVPAALVGRWQGLAPLDSGRAGSGAAVDLTIAPDGRVTGTVGNALLVEGRIGRNPSLLSRLFGLGTRWMIEASLSGPIDKASLLRRERTRMPLDLVDRELVGDLNASGGGKALSVRLRLSRAP